ncbi:MAG TPA: hypothetical protein ENJ37_06095 [Deltaproteobacteria bacterium]|nr:hypothetical protein [Deltaproteobacteria bacterium]
MYNLLRRHIVCGLVLAALLAGGCAPTSLIYISPSANFSYIKKVAVLPFNNLSEDRYAGERVRSIVTVDLMSRQVFEVMEQGEVSKVLSIIFREEGFEEGRAVQVDKETLNLIEQRLGVQAVILGSVDEYSGGRYGGNTVVSISLRMLDTSSGIILWQVSVTELGGSIWRKLIGLEDIDKSVLTQRAVKRALDTLV